MTPSSFGILGRLEAARQALEESMPLGLSLRLLMMAAGYDTTKRPGGSNEQAFLAQLTTYCAIYEDDNRRRYYLNVEMDENFVRKIFANETIFQSIPDEGEDEDEQSYRAGDD